MAGVAITRTEHTPVQLRRAASRTGDAGAARRMLALALVMEGKSRSEAAVRAEGIAQRNGQTEQEKECFST